VPPTLTIGPETNAPPGQIQIDLPRPQKGGHTQHLLATLFGEIWRRTDQWLPSPVIQELALDLELTRSATSTGLSRLSGRGVLEQSSSGRRSFYRVTQAARERLDIGFEKIASFGAPGPGWNGRWTVVAFSIPESDRALREVFRARLKWLGFASLYGALWVSPRGDIREIEAACHSFGVADFMVCHVDETTRLGKDPVTAWDLKEAAAPYLPFIDEYSPWLERVDAGISPKEAFATRIALVNQWRTFPWNDPDLPAELLPDHWPLPSARQLFLSLYDALLPGTREHVETRLRAVDPDLVPTIRVASIPLDQPSHTAYSTT
jgi:phenylacetic acid degradation operon negative regulatory protein